MTNQEVLVRFGFSLERGGAHLARTMMLKELDLLLAYVNASEAKKDDYIRAIVSDNCLGKRSLSTRKLTANYLANQYALDPDCAIFRAMLFFWNRDEGSRPLLALLGAYTRDAILRSSISFILSQEEGYIVVREDLEHFIEQRHLLRFSKSTLKSAAQNINSTCTQAGYTVGRVKKVRTRAKPTPGSAAFALLLGYITGVRGEALLETEYAKLLDCSSGRIIELAEEASRSGWIIFKRVGKVIEVLFPRLLNEQEREWLNEQD